MRSPGPPPANAGTPSSYARRDPTDLVYVGNRLFVAFRHTGVAVSDNHGGAFRWVTINFTAGLPATSRVVGRMSMAANEDANAVYVLGEVTTNPGGAGNQLRPHVWRIGNPAVAAPAAPTANALGGAPSNARLWTHQRDYDQAIAVTTRTTNPGPAAVKVDRVYIGGSLIGYTNGLDNWNASLWAFDVSGANLIASPGVSDKTSGGVKHGANIPGLIGNGIHPDVHAIRAAGSGNARHLWVACDGGVFVSLRNGQTNTFASRNVGLASIETEFVACHPSSSHFAMLGCQDNGRQVRVGESVWELKADMQGDGGGVIFHPVQSHYVMGQFAQADWACDPKSRYRPPIVKPSSGADAEDSASAFYSGIDAIRRTDGNMARIALGTNRVWVTDNLGTRNKNTWRVLPITPQPAAPPVGPPSPPTPLAWRDPRPGNRHPSTAANQAFGVPTGPALGAVLTVKWVNPTTLLALYRNGIIKYTEGNGHRWTSATLFTTGMAAPAAPLVRPAATFFTDIAPVPGKDDFYLTCTGQTSNWKPAVPAVTTTPVTAAKPAVRPTAAADSCFFYDSSAKGFRTTGLGAALPIPTGLAASPIDPAYSVVVDPSNENHIYVGTVTGVWRGVKAGTNANPTWTWSLFANGLPQSTVQDLKFWTAPEGEAANRPRLLRAALQSRGVWEVNLAAQEASRTYLRVHERDDRRILPTPMKNPRRHPGARDVAVYRSPDITIRPRSPVLNKPSFRRTLSNGRFKYQLWTFQTAFRWLMPSVIPNGEWSDQFADLVERYRRANNIPNPGRRRVDRALWDHVMNAAIDEAGQAGVYRAPWQNVTAPNLPGSEIDLIESVVPRRDRRNIWQVYREQSTVDILLHHRDTRPVPANGAAAILLWREDRSHTRLLANDCGSLIAYAKSQFTNSPQQNPPNNWRVARDVNNAVLHKLSIPLAARMPRSVEIDIDLSGVANGRRVLLLALAGSTTDPFDAAAAGPTDSVSNFVRNWPHAAARIISVWNRPGTQLF